MTRRNTIKYLEEKLWRIFSKFIRLSYADKNCMVSCFTCGSVHKWSVQRGTMQAGHFIGKRDCPPLTFDEKNVRPQCNSCNSKGQGLQYLFGIALSEEIGQEGVDKLIESRNKYKKWEEKNPGKDYEWERDWLNNKIAHYEYMVKNKKCYKS